MQFVDLAHQQQRIKEQIDENIQAVLNHGKYILGPEVKKLEGTLSNYVGVKHAIGCSSGTDALLLALMAYNVGPGDAIFTSPFTFIATAEVIKLLGATPVFVDIDPETFNMDPAKLELAIRAVKAKDSNIYPLPRLQASTSDLNPRVVIPVDLFGLPADYDPINAIADENGLFVIEDAAQSFGGEYKGKKACSLAHIACTSFFPAKPLGCYGDGGMCFTNDDNPAELLRSLVVHGKGHDKYDNVRVGINGRLDSLQAAILLAKFDIFPEEVKLRQQVAQRYTENLRPLSSHRGVGPYGPEADLRPPFIPQGMKSAWAQYSILSQSDKHRSSLQDRLKEADIPTAIYYPKPLHLQTAFASLGYKEGDFPISEDYASRIFSLPMHPYLKPEDQEKIIGAMRQ